MAGAATAAGAVAAAQAVGSEASITAATSLPKAEDTLTPTQAPLPVLPELSLEGLSAEDREVITV